jgi:hypothetical protein
MELPAVRREVLQDIAAWLRARTSCIEKAGEAILFTAHSDV